MDALLTARARCRQRCVRFQSPLCERAPSVSQQKPGFCNAADCALDLEYFAVIFRQNNLFSSFDVQSLAFVFNAVYFHSYIVKKNSFLKIVRFHARCQSTCQERL